MARCRSTIAANVATEASKYLCSGQLQLLAWVSPVETRKRFCLLPKSGALFQRSDYFNRRDYVSARAEARVERKCWSGSR